MRFAFTALVASVAVAAIQSMALALPASYERGVQAYNAHQYKPALAYFSDAARTAPSSPEVHYYLGLCYQALNQTASARQQYEWVVQQSANPALRAQAGAAFQQLSRYGSTPKAQPAQQTAFKPSGPKLNGRLQVMEFYADW